LPVRAVSPTLASCELKQLAHQPVDVEAAAREHDALEQLLAQIDAEVRRLPALPGMPDAAFVEDTAIVLDEVAVITRARAGRPG
jgi:dimethylargininase